MGSRLGLPSACPEAAEKLQDTGSFENTQKKEQILFFPVVQGQRMDVVGERNEASDTRCGFGGVCVLNVVEFVSWMTQRLRQFRVTDSKLALGGSHGGSALNGKSGQEFQP